MRHSAILPRKIGMKPLHRIEGEGAHLEGGDFYPFGDTGFHRLRDAHHATGHRSAYGARPAGLKPSGRGQGPTVQPGGNALGHLFQHYRPQSGDASQLGKDFTDPDSPDLLLADIYLRGANGVYTKTEEDVGFVELLRSRIGAAIIPISERILTGWRVIS